MEDRDDIPLKEQATRSRKTFEKAFKQALIGLFVISIVIAICSWEAAILLFISGCIVLGYSRNPLEPKDCEDVVDIICSNINRPPADLYDCSQYIRNELAKNLLIMLVITYCIGVGSGIIFSVALQ